MHEPAPGPREAIVAFADPETCNTVGEEVVNKLGSFDARAMKLFNAVCVVLG